MNNRNQNQRTLVPAPTPAPTAAPTYLNVFTVEEYESNGKTGKRWTKIGAAFPHKEGIGFSIELKAFRSTVASLSFRLTAATTIDPNRHFANFFGAPGGPLFLAFFEITICDLKAAPSTKYFPSRHTVLTSGSAPK